MQQNQSRQFGNGGVERRAYPRHRPLIDVRELVPGKHAYRVQSVSAGGMSCETAVLYEPGVLVVLEIDLKRGLMAFCAPARVVRSRKIREGYELSFQFLMPQVQMIPYLSNP